MKSLFPLLFLALTALSFTGQPTGFQTGTYGVCACGDHDPAHISLTLNDDHSFRYVNNNSYAPRTLDLSGTWAWQGNTLVLGGFQADVPVHTVWRMDKNQPCLKSWKGAELSRLCLSKK